MKNYFRDLKRREQTKKKHEGGVLIQDTALKYQATTADKFERQQQIELIEKHWLELPVDDQEILKLMIYDDLRQEDIAKKLEMPVGTVKSRTSRAFKRLRALVKAETPA